MPRRILIIADSATGLSYQRALCPGDYDVQLFEHPADGIAAAARGVYDLILLYRAGADSETLDLLRQLRESDVAARIVIVSRNATVQAAVAAIKEGAADYVLEPSTAEELRSLLRRHEHTAHERPTALGVADATRGENRGFEGMLGQCPAMLDVFALIQRIAPSDSTVLVSGESGTGKEMVVRAIHRLSQRGNRPLLACDCTALAPTLLESELFGHVKGSFSGAIATKSGLFEVAHQGTLLLDEVANLSCETQGKLLRVLETRNVRKVGDTAEHEVDIRLIATTNRSLAEMVKLGEFRADLYYRLNVVPVALPPLRQRPGDVPLLAGAFLEQFSRRMKVAVRGFAADAMEQMETYSWPGNVRELRNIVERLAVLYGGSRIELSHLPIEIREARSTVSTAETPRTWDEFKRLKRQIIDDLERRFLVAALERASQNVTQAAENVGMQRPNFHAMLRSHNLKGSGESR